MGKPRFFLIVCTALLAATFSTYAGVLWNNFVLLDDNYYVIYNPQTAKGLSLDGFLYAWTTFESGNWIPLTWLSLQLDSTLFGMQPLGFHATNLLLHGINVLLLFGWLVRVTGSHGRSLVVASLFALHPLHVESVAWISERKDVLSTFWLLVTLFAYERFASRRTSLRYLTVCLCFALGLLSKPMLVTLPVLLLLVDFWPLDRWAGSHLNAANVGRYPPQSTRTLILEKAPLMPLSLFSGFMTILASAATNAFTATQGTSLINRTGNAVCSYTWYLAKTFVPTRLIVFYPHPMNHVAWSDVAVSGFFLAVISLYVAINGMRRPYLLFGWCWYLISLLPVIGLLQVGRQAHADRYVYIPHIGLLLLIVWEGHFWASRLLISRIAEIVVALIAIASCACLTTRQVGVWRTTETLWTHVLSIDPDNTEAQLQLSDLYLGDGRIDEASDLLQSVIKRSPEREALLKQRIEIHRKYAVETPDQARLFFELGGYFFRLEDLNSAIFYLTRAVALSPDSIPTRTNLAIALARVGRNREAQSEFETVLSRQPNDLNAHLYFGVLLQNTNQLIAARDQFAAALQIDPKHQYARERLNDVQNRLRQMSK